MSLSKRSPVLVILFFSLLVPLLSVRSWLPRTPFYGRAASAEDEIAFDGPNVLPVSSSGDYQALYPGIEIFPDGALGVVWLKAENASGSVVYSRSTDGGSSFSELVLDEGLPPGLLGSELTADQDSDGEHAAVVWERPRRGSAGQADDTREIMISQSYDGGATFGAPTIIAQADPDYYRYNPGPLFPRVVVRGDYVGVFWLSTAGQLQPGLHYLDYAYSEDRGETFHTAKDLGLVGSSYDITLLDDTLYYVSLASGATHVSFLKSTLTGESELLEEVVSIRDQGAASPRIASTADGRVYLAWAGRDFSAGDTFTYLRWTDDRGETLSDYTLLDAAPISLRHARGRLSLGVLADQSVLVVESRWDAGVYAYVSRDGGETFSSAIELHNAEAAKALYTTSIGFNSRDLWVVWDEPSANTNGLRLVANHASLSRLEVFRYELTTGWNFVGFPLRSIAPQTASSLLAEVQAQDGDCVEVARWDSAVGNWRSFVRDYSFGDFPIEPYKGYFLRCLKESQFSTEGRALSFELRDAFQPSGSGWYDLALPSDNLYTAASLVRAIDEMLPGRVVEVARWASNLGNWQVFVSGYPLPDFPIRKGEGIMIHYQSGSSRLKTSSVPSLAERLLSREAGVSTEDLGLVWQKTRVSGGNHPSLAISPAGNPSISFVRGLADASRASGTATALSLAQNDRPWVDDSEWSVSTVLDEPNTQHYGTALRYKEGAETWIAYSARAMDVSGSNLVPKIARRDSPDADWRGGDIDPTRWSADIALVVDDKDTFVFYTGSGLRMARTSDGVNWESSLLEQPASVVSSLAAEVSNSGTVGVATTSLGGGLYYGWSEDKGDSWTVVNVDAEGPTIGPSLAFDPQGNPFISYSFGENFETTKIAWSTDGGATWNTRTVPQLKGGPTSIVFSPPDRLFLASALGSKIYIGRTNSTVSEWQFQEVDDVGPLLVGSDLDMAVSPEGRLAISYVSWEYEDQFGSISSNVNFAWSDPVYTPPAEGILLHAGWNRVVTTGADSFTASSTISSIREDCGDRSVDRISRLSQGVWETFVFGYGGVDFSLSAGMPFYVRLDARCSWKPLSNE